MSPTYIAESKLLCRCLRITEAELEEAALYNDLETVQDVKAHTGAGGGCMTCHCAIKDFLRKRAQATV